MLRLLQTSDVHLGARHPFLGERAADLRERQAAAFERAAALAVSSKVDLVLIAGDLFDTGVVSRATVERAAASLHRLVAAGIRVVAIPGAHDAPGRASIYRAHDLAALAGARPGEPWVSVLTDDAPDLEIAPLGVRLTTRFPVIDLPEVGWRIGLIQRVDRPRDDEIAAAGVDYLAIGGLPAAGVGRAANVAWGASGSPELVDVAQAAAGEVLLVTLDEASAQPTVERARVGRTRSERMTVDLATVTDEPALEAAIAARADPDLILDVRLTGDWSDGLDLDPDRVAGGLADRFLRIIVRNEAMPPLSSPPLPPEDTIAGAFIRDLEARIGTAEADVASTGTEPAAAAELREALRLGRRLLAGRVG